MTTQDDLPTANHAPEPNSVLSKTLGEQQPDSEERVAIIAIHGVGQHLSGVSADAVATLLLSMGREEDSDSKATPYAGFDAISVDVPLRRVQTPPSEKDEANDRSLGSWWSKIWGIFNERRGFLARVRQQDRSELRKLHNDRRAAGVPPDRGRAGYEFMLTQLAGYEGDVDRNFQTVRLEGKRIGKSPATVHIYDSHYSDLNKPENGIVAFFFGFYQLLFHLAGLSLLAVYWAEAENVIADEKKARRWYVMSSAQAISVRLLTMFVPILNFVLLEIAASAFIDKAPASMLPYLSLGVAGVLGLGLTFFGLLRKGFPSYRLLWASVPILGIGMGIGILDGIAWLYVNLFHLDISPLAALLLLDWIVTAGLILIYIARKFECVRPGALPLSILLYVFNAGVFLLYLVPHAVTGGINDHPISTASVWAVQWIFGELSVCWVVCLLSALAAVFISLYCIGGIDKKGPNRKARAISAFRTGRFAFAVPAILFVIVTCALWSGVVVYGSGKFKAFQDANESVVKAGLSASKPWSFIIPAVDLVDKRMTKIEEGTSLAKCCREDKDTCQNCFWTRYLRGILLVSVTPGLPVTMAAFALALLLLAWAVLPSIVFETFPTSMESALQSLITSAKKAFTNRPLTPHDQAELRKSAENELAVRIRTLGEWLSRGLDNTSILTHVLWLAIVPIPLIFFTMDRLSLYGSKSMQEFVIWAGKYTLPLIRSNGLILLISGGAVFGGILKGLTTILDTVLDVDNYLRISPKDRTPRALIAERCTSLLRYIANYRDEQQRPYTKLIIVAHSLGSMVTTDLLRFLQRAANGDPNQPQQDFARDEGLARYGFGNQPIPRGQSKLPIYVFSMGSPIRQLLNRFFPHLYWWVSDVPDNSLAPLGPPVGPPIPPITLPPNVQEMNVAHWSNAYRTGDYVGRWLWIGQWFERNQSNDPKRPQDIAGGLPPAHSYAEMCIGLGAHTHYWDRSAPEVADWLNQLI